MKTAANQSPNATQSLLALAQQKGVTAMAVARAKPQTRRHSPNGSTHAPQKVVSLDGIRMSVGQAKQYLAAR